MSNPHVLYPEYLIDQNNSDEPVNQKQINRELKNEIIKLKWQMESLNKKNGLVRNPLNHINPKHILR